MVAPRPKVPPLFLEEIFHSRRYRQDFRSFLVKHDVVAPLQFLEATSGLKHFKDGSEKQLAHAQKIRKKFFGKEANFGKKLHCDDKIIHLISEAESIGPPFLFCAFIPVYRSMEKIWFRKYLQTFPGKAPSVRTVEISPVEAESEKIVRRVSQHIAPCDNVVNTRVTVSIATNDVKTLSHDVAVLFSFFRACFSPGARFVLLMEKTHSTRTLKKLVQFIMKMQSTPVHRQMIDYVHILYEEELEQMKAILRPRLKGGKKESEKFEETISGLKCGDLPNLERRILFLHDIIEYKTLYNCLNEYGGVLSIKPTLYKKARLIINKYLKPESRPDILLGVPKNLTIAAKMTFKLEGPTRTLFHQLTLQLLPLVFKIWKSMWIECTNCGGKAAFANIMKIKQQHYSSEETLNMLNNLKKETIIATNDHHAQFITLSFSIQKGIRVYVPKTTGAKEEKVVQRIVHRTTREVDTESVTDVRGGSRLGYVLIK